MTGLLLHNWHLNLGYAKRLVADLADDQMALQPSPGMNHAAWLLGHLACTADMLGAMIGVKPVCPADWAARFGWNSSPSSAANQAPSKAILLRALENAHVPVAAALPAIPESRRRVEPWPWAGRQGPKQLAADLPPNNRKGSTDES